MGHITDKATNELAECDPRKVGRVATEHGIATGMILDSKFVDADGDHPDGTAQVMAAIENSIALTEETASTANTCPDDLRTHFLKSCFQAFPKYKRKLESGDGDSTAGIITLTRPKSALANIVIGASNRGDGQLTDSA